MIISAGCHTTLLALFVISTNAGLATAADQVFPNHPVRIVNGFEPGGGTELMTRLLTPKMAETLGQQVIIDTRSGAGTNIAMEYVARSAPDGYTLLVNGAGIAINMSLYKNLNFDSVRDFTGVSTFATSPNVMVVHPSLPVHSIKELVALAHSKPGMLRVSSGSTGTVTDLTGKLFKLRTGTDMVHVPYRGNSPALIALISGEVELTVASIPAVIDYLKTGRLRPLATTGAARTEMLPDVPTMKESSVDIAVVSWYAIFAPAATPSDIVHKLADSIIRATRFPETRKRLLDLGAEPVGDTPEETTNLLRQETNLWASVARAPGVRED